MPDRAGQFRSKPDHCHSKVPQRVFSTERNCQPESAQGNEQHTDSRAIQVQENMGELINRADSMIELLLDLMISDISSDGKC